MLLSLSSRGSSGIWDVGCGLWFDTLQKRMRRKHLIVVYRQFYRLSSIVYRPAICEGRRTDQGCGVGMSGSDAGNGKARDETQRNKKQQCHENPIVTYRLCSPDPTHFRVHCLNKLNSLILFTTSLL